MYISKLDIFTGIQIGVEGELEALMILGMDSSLKCMKRSARDLLSRRQQTQVDLVQLAVNWSVTVWRMSKNHRRETIERKCRWTLMNHYYFK